MKGLAAEEHPGMSDIIRTITRWVSPFVILFGLYTLSVANDNPGGAFESGVVIACGLILLLLAFGKEAVTARIPVRLLFVLVSVGALMFLGVVFAEAFVDEHWLARIAGKNVHILSALGELGFAIEVIAALLLLLITFSVLRVKAGGTDDELVTDIED